MKDLILTVAAAETGIWICMWILPDDGIKRTAGMISGLLLLGLILSMFMNLQLKPLELNWSIGQNEQISQEQYEDWYTSQIDFYKNNITQ